MDDKNQKERLEQELRFLKESFEAEVISKEEFEKGKDRVEKKLKEIQNAAKPSEKQQTEPEKQKNQEKTEHPVDAAIQSKEPEKIKLKVIQDEALEQHFEAEQRAKEVIAEKPVVEEPKKKNKTFKYAIVFVVLILIVFFSYSYFKNKAVLQKSEMKFVAVCRSNEDCKQEGKIGICIAPDTKEAKCEFKDIQKTNVLVLNDRKNCFNCDTKRVLGILEQWFGAVNPKEINYSTNDGKAIAEKFNLNLLPAYIFDENITKNSNFENFKQAFVRKNSSYVLSDDAAGSTFYLRRESIPNRLDLFVRENDATSINAEKNLREFLENFNEAKFEKHNEYDAMAKQLNIKIFPTFLINNKIKFSGVHSAETIKDNFCKLNKLPECGKSLSKSLV